MWSKESYISLRIPTRKEHAREPVKLRLQLYLFTVLKQTEANEAKLAE